MLKKFLRRIKSSPLSKKEQGLFAERLSFLLDASLSLPESVVIMRNAFGKGRRRAFTELESSLESGVNFETSLARSPLCFSELIILAARIGERSGTLAESLRQTAGKIEKNRATVSALASAITYPAIIFMASIGIIAFLVFFIIPKIMPTIESLHVPLPPVTVFFIFISHFLTQEWLKILGGSMCVLGIFFLLYLKSIWFKSTIQQSLLRLPLVAPVIRAHILSELFDTLSTLVSAGCPFVEAISESAAFVSFIPYRVILKKSVQGIQKGADLSTTLRRHPRLFPPLAVDSIAIGERTGNMETILPSISRYYARELAASLAGLSKLIEPALMIGVGIIVGAAALSIVLPIYGISQHLSG